MSDKKDLTRIEDLSEFIHMSDPDVDEALKTGEDKDSESLTDLDDLDENEGDDFSPPSFDFSNSDSESDDSEENESESFSDDATETDFSIEESTENNFDMPELPTEQSEDSEDDSSDQLEEASFLSEDSELEESADFNSFASDEESSNEDLQENDTEEENSFLEEDESSFDFSESNDSEFSEGSEEASFLSEDESNEEESSNDFSFEEEEEDSLEESEDVFSSEQTENEDSSENQEDELSFNDGLESESEESHEEDQVEEASVETYEDHTSTENSASASRESFDDVKKFANSISYGTVAQGGNPPFSIILKNIKFEEDVEDILILLREHDLCNEQNEQTMRQGLENGALLISQISEFSAIYLAHRFRRFDLEIQLGLSEEIHPSKSYERNSFGLVSKSAMKQNKSLSVNLETSPVDLNSILLTTTSQLEGYDIHNYLGLISDSTIITHEELERFEFAGQSSTNQLEESHFDDEEQEFMKKYSLGLNETHNELANRLKEQALSLEANAIVGINFQMTPLIELEAKAHSKYKLTCTGNAVWVTGNRK